jgi:hypothetical protein
MSQEDSATTPVVFIVSVLLPSRGAAHHIPFWVKPISRFGLFVLYDVFIAVRLH